VKITSMEIFEIVVPLKDKYTLSKVIGSKSSTECVLVKIDTDEGIYGIGEADPHVPFTEESMESITYCILNYLSPLVIGQDPENIEGINSLMDQGVKLNLMAKGAIDMACYDILGKKRNLPIYEMFGGKIRDFIPLVWSVGNSPPEQTVKDVQKAHDEGFKTIMVKTGHFAPQTDIERIRLVRNAYPNIKIIVDVNQGWDVETSIEVGRKIAPLDIYFLEQPVPYWDIEGLAKIKKSIPIPISVDESLLTLHDARRIIREGAADIFSIKVSKNGGISRAQKLIKIAAENEIKCWMNSMLEEGITQAASLHLGLSTPNLLDGGHAYFSPLRLAADISTYSENIQDLKIYPPTRPGLGIDLKTETINRFLRNKYNFSATNSAYR